MFGRRRNTNRDVPGETEDAEETTFVAKLAHEPQTHLEQYLAYYVGCEKPGYAVLITGEWGTGKTHQVTVALPAGHAHYISLFGLNSPEEIEAQVFAKMFPKKASLKKLADKLSAVSVGVPGYGSLGVNGLASVLATSFIKNEIDNSRPLIFDDLERCTVENSKILGIINRYVEHHGCRVVVIAHDSKIVEEFKDAKEKVFGQTLVVEPNVDAAFEEFNAFFAKQDKHDLLGDLKYEVLTTFKESDASSLRVLRHVVEDVRRLVATLEERHRENRTAMVELIRLFSAFAIEYRTNAISNADLKDRGRTITAFQMGAFANKSQKEEPPLVKSASKYKSVDLTNTLINDLCLREMLVEGRFTATDIRDSVNASAYFLEQQASPPWQIVINFNNLDDNVVGPALHRMEEQFTKREVTESGEFLHIVALKMLMSIKNVTEQTVHEIADAAKIYIDDLLNECRLPPRPADLRWTESFETAYGGTVYCLDKAYKSEFKEVFDYLVDARKKALEENFPAMIPPLLEVVRRDGHEFFVKACYTREGIIEYQHIPILAGIPAKDFVDAWLASPKMGWYWIGNALKERNQAIGRDLSLKPEAVSMAVQIRA